MLRSNFLHLAIGQAAGNIGLLFEEKQFPVLYINTSIQDLDTIKNGKQKYHINGGEGCNKDRNKSKALLDADFDNVLNLVKNFVDAGARHINVIFSAAGGTGSGAGPMTAYLLSREIGESLPEDTIVGTTTILPAESESYRAHSNAYFCFKEILKLEDTGACFVLDNRKVTDSFSIFDINTDFVEAFTDFVDIPDNDRSTKGNIDTAEIKTVLAAHNTAIFLKSRDVVNTVASILSQIHSNIYAPIEKDNILQYIAFSMANKSVAFKSLMAEFEKAIGMPLDDFKTYNERGTSIVCISGLSFPVTRIQLEAKIVANKSEQAQSILGKSSSLNDDIVDVFAANSKSRKHKTNGQDKPKNRRDMLEDFFNS